MLEILIVLLDAFLLHFQHFHNHLSLLGQFLMIDNSLYQKYHFKRIQSFKLVNPHKPFNLLNILQQAEIHKILAYLVLNVSPHHFLKELYIFELNKCVQFMAALLIVYCSLLFFSVAVPVKKMLMPFKEDYSFRIGELEYLLQADCPPLTVPVDLLGLSCFELVYLSRHCPAFVFCRLSNACMSQVLELSVPS